jgi:hypothetical protein
VGAGGSVGAGGIIGTGVEAGAQALSTSANKRIELGIRAWRFIFSPKQLDLVNRDHHIRCFDDCVCFGIFPEFEAFYRLVGDD